MGVLSIPSNLGLKIMKPLSHEQWDIDSREQNIIFKGDGEPWAHTFQFRTR